MKIAKLILAAAFFCSVHSFAADAKESNNGADDIRIGKADAPSNDVDEEAAVRRSKAEAAKKELDAKDKKLLDVIRNGPQQPPDAPKAPAAKDGAKTPGDKDWEKAVACIETGNYKKAAQLLKGVASSGVTEDITKADALVRQKFNRSLSDVIVMCYVTDKCPTCSGRGVIQCSDCNGSGYTMLNIDTPSVTDKSGRPEYARAGPAHNNLEGARSRIQVCLKCRGQGNAFCSTCFGTGLAFNEPTPYERDAYSAYCQKLATESLSISDVNYGDTARETTLPFVQTATRTSFNMVEVMEQVWLKDSADRVKSDILRLWRAEGFYRLALKADPALMIRSTKDLTQELIKIDLRRQNLYGELSERIRSKDFKREE